MAHKNPPGWFAAISAAEGSGAKPPNICQPNPSGASSSIKPWPDYSMAGFVAERRDT
jgi:hypothetical protein